MLMKEILNVFKSGEDLLGRAIFVFLLAGLLEVGGGFWVWRWVREGGSIAYGLAGAVLLGLYGVVAALSPFPFGRAYAAYGGIFVLISIFWAMKFDGFRPDPQDWYGAILLLTGIVVMTWPRK